MATSIVVTKATPYSLAVQMASDDGALGTYTGAALVALCVPGPLRALLVKYTAASKLDHLNINAAGPGIESKGLVRIRSVDGITGAQTPPAVKTIEWTATGLNVRATAASTCQLEIRLAHSHER